MEDDWHGLAKTADFMRGVSFLFIIIHLYWFCHDTFQGYRVNTPDNRRSTRQFSTDFGPVLFSDLYQDILPCHAYTRMHDELRS